MLKYTVIISHHITLNSAIYHLTTKYQQLGQYLKTFKAKWIQIR
jgi:hypothetical protein